MGGKDKKGPRTKGNTKPSSSGRSAELLGHIPEFVGFGGLPEGSYVPIVGINSQIEDASSDLNVPADFRLSLRKMGKRDSITKIKALQEFSELCKQNSVDTLKCVLPFWPRIFSRLAVDGDRRVREYLHKSHSQLTSQLGRNIAPHLKDMMGAWFTSQCDTYAPAASLASHSLKTCFPGNKLLDAISFCHNEIMDYIKDSIFKEENLPDEQQERITIGGIGGYSLLLQQVKSDVIEAEKNLPRHTEVWENANLYKVVEKSKSLIIKQAWFGLIYNLVHYLPKVAQDNSKKILPSVFKFLDDSESTSQLALWETTLKILMTVENASSYVNLPSHATPRFLNLLRSACSGNASKICPLVVPYVRLLRDNKKTSTEKEELDRQVIEALFQGLLCRNIANSSVEASALSSTLFQLLDYIIEVTQDSTHVTELLKNTFIPSLDLMIKSQCSESVVSAVIRQMTTTLNSWFRTKEKIATEFWDLLEVFIKTLTAQPPQPESSSVFKNVALIILVLMNSHSKLDLRAKMTKRVVRLRFADANADCDNKVQEASVVQLPEMPILFKEKVVNMSVVICKDALKRCEIGDCDPSLRLFASLIECEDILRGLLSVESASSIESMLCLIQRLLQKLRDNNTSTLFLSILDGVDRDLRHKILEELSLDNLTYISLATTALENSNLSQKQVVSEWLESANIGELLISTTRSFGNFHNEDENSAVSWRLLRAAFNAKKLSSRVHLLPKEHISGIMNAFIEILRDEHIEEDSIAFVIQKFSNMLKPSAAESNFLLESSDEWLDSLVDVLCSTKHIQPESFSMLLEMWKHGASYSIHCRCQSAVTVIKRKLLAIPECGMAERLVEVFQHIFELELQQNDPEALCLIVRQVLLTDAEWTGWMKEATSCDLMAKEIMSGNYCHFVPITNNFKPVQLNSWVGLLNAAFVVSSIMVHNQDTFEKDRTEIIPNIFFASAVADLLQETNRNRTKDAMLKDIEKMSGVLESNANILLSSCSTSEKTEVIKKTVFNSRQYRWIWCLVARKLQTILPQSFEENETTEDVVMILSSLSDEKLNRITLSQISKLSTLSTNSWTESYQILTSIRFLLEKLKANINNDTMDALIESMKILQSWQLEHDESFLFGLDLKNVSRSGSSVKAVWTVIEIIRLLSTVVELYPVKLVHSLWDFILCSMTSWCTTLEESWAEVSSSNLNTNPFLLSFTVALSRLIQSCGTLMADVEQKKEELISAIPPNLVSEWNDVFSDATYNAVLPIFLRLSRNNPSHLSAFYLMETLALSVRHAPMKVVQPTAEKLSSLLLAKHSAIQFAAHGLIIKLLPEITSTELAKSKEEVDGDEEKTERPPPQALLLPLEKVALEDLDELRCGDLHTTEPYSEECTQLIGYFLGWDVILRLCGCSSSELRYQYASYLSNSNHISRLMNILFCIIPHASFQQQADLEIEFLPNVVLTEKVIQNMAVMVYSSALRHLPAVVRRWCNNADKRTASLVEKFTSRCVSPVLCTLDLQFCSKTWDNMTVRVRPTAREVIATYKLNEEGSMELIMQLPANYPLGNIVVETGRKVGVTASQWRSWILQLQTFLMQQNGSILDGLSLWKRNVDKRFEGIEECCICYYVLHGSNYQLPKLSCRTCRKKFHAHCLYKWFSTSNNSTCPFCRNLF